MKPPQLEAAPLVRDGGEADAPIAGIRPGAASWTAREALPWLTSVMVHGAIIVLALVTARAIFITPKVAFIPQEVIPIGTSEDVGQAANTPELARGEGTLKAMADFARQDVDSSVDTSGVSRDRGPGVDVSAALGAPGGGAAEVADLLQSGSARLGGGPGSGNGANGSGGIGAGGPLAQFGRPNAGGGENGTGLFKPPSGGARRIIYACDASGSMINKAASLKSELVKSIARLNPAQAFNIIMFHDTKLIALDTGSLVLANPANRRRASEFLEGVSVSGTTDPIPGLEAAFKQKPDLIYLLTDGDFPDNDEVLVRIRQLNKDHKVKVNTIAFVDANDQERRYLTLLNTIATENGGTFRHVRMSDLGE